eukprot:1645126-Rhodomonas_salina.1
MLLGGSPVANLMGYFVGYGPPTRCPALPYSLSSYAMCGTDVAYCLRVVSGTDVAVLLWDAMCCAVHEPICYAVLCTDIGYLLRGALY